MKLLTALKYKFQVCKAVAAWFLTIYPIAMILVSFILVKTSTINEYQGSLIYRLGASGTIFLFASFIRFKEDFDFLLTLGITRRDIFIANTIIAVGLSTLVSILVVVERAIVDYFNNMLGFHNANDPFHLFGAYALDNLFIQFIYFLMLGSCCALTGVLLGSLFYRLGKKFTLVFWLPFSAIPTIVLPMYMWAMYNRNELASSMSALGTYLKTFNVLSASGTLLVITIVVCVAEWLNIRRLPQTS